MNVTTKLMKERVYKKPSLLLLQRVRPLRASDAFTEPLKVLTSPPQSIKVYS